MTLIRQIYSSRIRANPQNALIFLIRYNVVYMLDIEIIDEMLCHKTSYRQSVGLDDVDGTG